MSMLILTIIFPLIGFLLLSISKEYFSENFSAVVGVSSVGLSALVTGNIIINFFKNNQHSFNVPLWTLISTDNFNISFNLMLDGLSLTMISIITGIGFLIHIFASWYMKKEEGYSRFFAYTNLFVASMIVLVLADNLMMMYFGWEIMGLCSYLLIGFYYTDLKSNKAATKAFVITRIGGVFLVLSLFILYNELGTLNFKEIAELVPIHFEKQKSILWWATLMLLGGAISKSAQLPLQTWLPDAMEGPTPVSALIHATTMVTVGVYLIARTYYLFLAVPEILYLVGIIGAITLILAGFSAMVQTDIKRILAYSTMSQIGYMFLALGVQAWDSAIFHLMTHSFFKALLFLASGSLILSCDHEQNIFKIKFSQKSVLLIYSCFLIGGAALTSFPLVTSSFFSKGKILTGAMASDCIKTMIVGLVGTFITSLYTFRMIFIIFHGKKKNYFQEKLKKGITHHFPLIILSILSTAVGAMITPPLKNILPDTAKLNCNYVLMLEIISSIITISGILLASWLWLRKNIFLIKIFNSMPGRFFYNLWYNAWGFDWLYNMIFVKSFLSIARILEKDPLNRVINILVIFTRFAEKSLLLSENRYLRWQIASMSIGAAFLLSLFIVLN